MDSHTPARRRPGVQPGTNNTTNLPGYFKQTSRATRRAAVGPDQADRAEQRNPGTDNHLSNPNPSFTSVRGREGQGNPENIWHSSCIATEAEPRSEDVLPRTSRDGTSNGPDGPRGSLCSLEARSTKPSMSSVVVFPERHDGSLIRQSAPRSSATVKSARDTPLRRDSGVGHREAAPACPLARAILHQPREWGDNRWIDPP